MKFFRQFLIGFGICCLLLQVPFSCAHRGTPGGGPIDTIPPKVLKSKPANYSTHFKSKVIRIEFDEYIKLKDPATQILISPPMKRKPIISPQGIAQKYIEIEIRDSLKSNTTYTINFGQSIEDNNEGNQLPFYKYVFSTGDFIDSLKVSGRVTDAFNRLTDEHISVMLYKFDSDYYDSIIYKEPPAYIAYTRDSTHTFEIENVAEGNYKLFALKDKNQNYLFDPKSDKIGFLSDTIQLPSDKTYNLKVFREKPKFKAAKISQESLQHLLFGFEGGAENVEIKMLSETPLDFSEHYFKHEKKDSIDYWFKPYFEADSLLFEVSKNEIKDTLKIHLQEVERDSLRIKAQPASTLDLGKKFYLTSNTPVLEVNEKLINIFNKDSVNIPFKTKLLSEINKIEIDFDAKEKEIYQIQALPGAITDFFQHTNDSLQYKIQTKAETEYADIHLTIENISSFPVILQLTNEAGEVKLEKIHQQEDGNVFDFSFVEPGMYYVRLIYDNNNNGKWDSGNYLKNQQPEKVIYMPKPLDVRKNWEISQIFSIK